MVILVYDRFNRFQNLKDGWLVILYYLSVGIFKSAINNILKVRSKGSSDKKCFQ